MIQQRGTVHFELGAVLNAEHVNDRINLEPLGHSTHLVGESRIRTMPKPSHALKPLCLGDRLGGLRFSLRLKLDIKLEARSISLTSQLLDALVRRDLDSLRCRLTENFQCVSIESSDQVISKLDSEGSHTSFERFHEIHFRLVFLQFCDED